MSAVSPDEDSFRALLLSIADETGDSMTKQLARRWPSGSMTEEHLFVLENAVADELCRSGFDERSDITEKGRRMEALIDEIVRRKLG